MRVCGGGGAEIAAHYSRLDVLVDNAGLHAFAQRITSEGFADRTAVNCLGPFVLTEALKAKAGRLGAGTERHLGLRSGQQARTIAPAEDLRRTEPRTRRESVALYGRTKLMTIC